MTYDEVRATEMTTYATKAELEKAYDRYSRLGLGKACDIILRELDRRS